MTDNRASRSMTASRKEEELADLEVKTKIVTAWMEGLLKEKLPQQPLREVLLDGVVLCKLANAMKPGCIRKYHRRPKMLMMKMENIAFFLAVAKSRFSVPAATLFSPTDVHDDSDPAAMLKVLRVLLLLRTECPGEAVIDADLLKALEDSNKADEAAAASVEPTPDEPEPTPDEPEPTPSEPEPTPDEPEPEEDPELAAAEKAAAEAAQAALLAQQAAEAARVAQANAAASAAQRQAAKEKAEREAKEKAEKEAAEKAAAEAKAAADKAAKEKAEREAKEKAEKEAAEKAAAEAKAAADKAAQAKTATKAAAPAAGGVSSASTSYLGGNPEKSSYQSDVLAEILGCIHSELTVSSKQSLSETLGGHLKAIQEKVMYSSDKELRVLCHEMGLGQSLAAVPENKERKFYVEWILNHGRITSA